MNPSSGLIVERFASPAAFLSAAAPALMQAEVENALILGVARDLAQRTTPPAVEPYFACVREGERVLMCAFRSLLDKAGITRASDPVAMRMLAEDLRDACPGIREVVGPEPTIGTFAQVFAELQGRRVRLLRKSRIHVLHKVTPITPKPPGHLRSGRESELDLVTRWMEAFLTEVAEEGIRGDLATRWLREGKIYLWVDGLPVSVAAATGKTANGIRISFVYTPPGLRKRGYASACVATLSKQLIDAGNEYCCLYTDLANPTSNKIYREIGYEPVCDAASYLVV
jgi:predicted GNAT family acetyltransferase